MRTKDVVKQEALFKATIKLVNEIGFAASSISKIAKEAEISPATIYVYHKNKDDLLVSTYIEIKKELSRALFSDYDDSLPIRDILRRIWLNGFAYAYKHYAYLNFTQQFSNSPFSDLLDKEEIARLFEPLMETFQRGIDQKIIKDVEFELLNTFVIYPVIILSNRRLCSQIKLSEDNIERAFCLAWDAIKL